MNKLLSLLALSFIFAHTAQAEDINLVADERVELYQNEQKMVAIGNAVASKKDLSIRADKMTGYYATSRVNGKDRTGIKTVHAVGNVKMSSPKADGFGETMDYDVAADTMTLRGHPAKIKTEKENITAEETITYYPSLQKAIALGNVIATNAEGNKVRSDKMISYFTKDKDGNMVMDRVEIFDNVKITTKDAVVTADKGLYLPNRALVKLFNNVIINQDGNILKGDMAETNLDSGVSKLLSKKSSGKRVSGVFKEKDDQQKSKKNDEKK